MVTWCSSVGDSCTTSHISGKQCAHEHGTVSVAVDCQFSVPVGLFVCVCVCFSFSIICLREHQLCQQHQQQTKLFEFMFAVDAPLIRCCKIMAAVIRILTLAISEAKDEYISLI